MKTLFTTLVGLFLCVTLTGADEPTTAPAVSMIADVKNGSVEIGGKKFAFGSSADALIEQLGKPKFDNEEDSGRTISYQKSLGFDAAAWQGKLNAFSFYLRRAPGAVIEHAPANVKTVEGIGASSTQEQIEKAYGKSESILLENVTMLRYARVTFFLDKDGLFLMMLMADEP